MNDITVLVMAAGMGSRYGGLKQLDAVGPNGETIIDYSVYDAIQAALSQPTPAMPRKPPIHDQSASRTHGRARRDGSPRIFPK